MPVSSYKIKDYVLDLQKMGMLTFTLNEVRERFHFPSPTLTIRGVERV